MLDKARSLAIENLYLLIFREELTKESLRNIAYLIWGIDNFGHKDSDAEIRVGIEMQMQEDFQELVVRVSDEIFWIGIEAIHRTESGSDSYEIIHFIGYPDGSFEGDPDPFFDIFGELMKEENLPVRTEYHGEFRTY